MLLCKDSLLLSLVVVVHGLLIVVASLVVKHGLKGARASVVVAWDPSCPMACGILVLGSGIKSTSPVLAGRFLTTGPPGKSLLSIFAFPIVIIPWLSLILSNASNWVPLHASHCFQRWCFKTCTFFKRTQWIKYVSLWVFLLSSAFSSTMIFQKEAIYWELRGHQGEGNGTHSSTLAWKIPWTEEPGGLPSMGSHRVRHDWSDLAAAAAARGHLPEVSENPTAFYLRVYFYPRAYQLKSLKEWHLSRNCIPRAELHVFPAPSHWGQ